MNDYLDSCLKNRQIGNELIYRMFLSLVHMPRLRDWLPS
jgi:hypothetical protein